MHKSNSFAASQSDPSSVFIIIHSVADKEMMDYMASRSGAEKSTKRRARDPCSRPMPRAARIKLELKMEASAEGPDSDEEMMALLGRGDEGGCGGGGGAPAAQGIGQRIKVRGGSFE